MTGDRIVLVGSYAPADRPGIRAFRFAPRTRHLSEIGSWSGVDNPSFIALSRDQQHLYAVSEVGDGAGLGGSVHAFAVSWTDGHPHLDPLGSVPSGGDHPCHLGLDPNGHWVTVSNYGSGTVALRPRRVDGTLDVDGDTFAFTGGSVHTQRQSAPHTHSATPTPDGRFVIVADLGADRLVTFEVVDGRLVERHDGNVRPGAGPRHVAIHPNGRLVAVANELDNTVTTAVLDADGRLSHRARTAILPVGSPASLTAEIRFSGDGTRVLASVRGVDLLVEFDVDDGGALTLAATRPTGGAWPRHFAPIPGSGLVLVANERSDAIAVVDPSGALVATATMPAPTCVVVGRRPTR